MRIVKVTASSLHIIGVYMHNPNARGRFRSMSDLRVREKGADQSINLREFLNHHSHMHAKTGTYHNNESRTNVYKGIRIAEKLGEGSTGVAYQAFYRNVDGQYKQCVVKLPVRLLNSNQIQLGDHKNGKIIIIEETPKGHEYEYAREELDYEWKNNLQLHFGKNMEKYGMGTKEWSISDKELKSVIDESKKLKQINGYNNIHKIQSADLEVPLLISEYFDGTVEDFSKMLEKLEYKTQMKQIFEFIIPQTLAGLHFMHSKNVQLAHMDIKPANMLYKFAQGRPHPLVVLCDFGLCQPSEDPVKECMGTPYFRAPEIVSNETSLYIPKYTDAYSWAVSMLYLLYPHAMYDWPKSLVNHLLLQVSKTPPLLFNDPKRETVFQNILDIIQAESPPKRYRLFEDTYNIYFREEKQF
jgi:serine/threonine protein kinase